MANLYMLIIVLILFWLQLLLGSIALHIPLCIGGIFYISVAYSWRQGVFWAVLGGISLDLFYGRGLFISSWAFPATGIFAEYWRRKNDTRHLRNCMLPGAIIALLSVLPLWIYKLILYNADISAVVKDLLPGTIFALSFNAFFLPLLVLVLDGIGEKIKLPLFTRANKRLLKERK